MSLRERIQRLEAQFKPAQDPERVLICVSVVDADGVIAEPNLIVMDAGGPQWKRLPNESLDVFRARAHREAIAVDPGRPSVVCFESLTLDEPGPQFPIL